LLQVACHDFVLPVERSPFQTVFRTAGFEEITFIRATPLLLHRRIIELRCMIIFLHIPKTGGTSFRFILERNLGLSHCHTNHTNGKVFGPGDLAFARKCFPRLRSIAGHNLIDPLSLPVSDPYYMTFLREPVARVFSHYQFGVQHGQNRNPFEESLRRREDLLSNLYVKLMAGGENLDRAKLFLEKCSFVGLTEKFDLSLNVLRRLDPFGLNLQFERKIVAKDNTIKKRLEQDPKMVELAREKNKLDLQLYDFAIREVFPRLCDKAGIKPSDPVTSFEKPVVRFKWKYHLGRIWNRAVYRQICKLR
jgi:hypothetical protein